MTLSYQCVIQTLKDQYCCDCYQVGSGAIMGGRVFEITRMTEEYCKVRNVTSVEPESFVYL